MNIEMTTITPPMAALLLGNNGANRKLNKRHVDFLADQIKSGKWQKNGQTIVIAKDGTLMDGQHRLTAIVAANVPVAMGLCTGAPRASMPTIDNGKPRSSADVLTMSKCSYATLVAASIHLLYKFDNESLATNGTGGGTKMPNSVVMPALKDIQARVDLDWLAKIVQKTGRNTRMKVSNLFVAFYLIASKYGEDIVTQFAEKMNDGGDYPKSPTLVMPQIIARIHASGRSPHRAYDLAMLLAGFDRWIEVKKMSQYRESSVVNDIQEFTKTYNAHIRW